MHDDRSLVKHAFVVRQSFAIGYQADRYTPTVKITLQLPININWTIIKFFEKHYRVLLICI